MLFGKYRLIRKLATGGMAEIFLARQEGMEGFRKDVVIKRILPIHADNDELINMFLDEARIAATLNHPNVVQIYELGKFEDDYFIAMEYVHGQDLRKTAERGLAVGNFLPLRHAVRLIADAAAGLHYAHTQIDNNGNALNIVHRDISPQNILISFDGVVKVLDFGIAKAENKIVHTRTGQLKGKYAYMSPEQCNGLDVDSRSDIFSMGTLLYEITLCRRLFKGETDIQTIKRVSEAEFTLPRELQPEFPEELQDIILKALAKDPEERYQTARELQVALEDFLDNNRMKTGPLQVGEYLQEIFPDKLERPGEDPTFVAQFASSSKSAMKAKTESTEAKAEANGKPEGGPPTGGPPGRPVGGPPGQMPPHLKGRPPGGGPPPGGPPGRPPGGGPPPGHGGGPPAPPAGPPPKKDDKEGAPSGAVSYVVSPDAPYAAHSVVEHKRKRRKVSSRSSVKTVEYQLRSEDEGDLESYERGSRLYYYILGAVVLLMLGYAGYLIYNKGGMFAGSELLKGVSLEDEDPDVGVEALPEPLPQVQVNVTSEPAGAAVVVNGILQQGEAPGDFNVVPGQMNTISLYLKGHYPIHKNIRAPDNGVPEPVALTLEVLKKQEPIKVDPDDPTKEEDEEEEEEKDPKEKEEEEKAVVPVGTISVKTEPEGAEVFLDGRSVGVTPVTVEGVAGFVEHHVTVRKKDFYEHAIVQYVHPNQLNPIGPDVVGSEGGVIKLTPEADKSGLRFVRVHIGVLPRTLRDAIIYLNDSPVGVSGMFHTAERHKLLRVEIKHDSGNYKPWVRVLATTVGAIWLKPQLEKINRDPGTLTLKVKPEGLKIFVGSNEEKEVKKMELPSGELEITFQKPDESYDRVKVSIEAGNLSEYEIDFTGEKIKSKRLK